MSNKHIQHQALLKRKKQKQTQGRSSSVGQWLSESDEEGESYPAGNPQAESTPFHALHLDSTQASDETEERLRSLEDENEKLREAIEYSNPGALNTTLLQKINESLTNSVEIKIEPCEPTNNEEISTADWDYWKTSFEAWLELTKTSDPMKQQAQFVVKAGRKLVTALKTAPELKHSVSFGWELTKEKLDNVYNTRANNFSLQRDFRMLKQKHDEKNVAYLSRVMNAAMLIWKKEDPKLDEEITLVVAIHSNCARLQEFAATSSENNERRRYDDLVEKARILDGVIEINQKQEKPALLAVGKSNYTPRHVYGSSNKESYQERRREYRDRDDYRSVDDRSDRRDYRDKSRGRDKSESSNTTKRFRPNETKPPCFRCSGNHPHWKCDKVSTPCGHCGLNGHAISVCRSRIREEAAVNDEKRVLAGSKDSDIPKPKEV